MMTAPRELDLLSYFATYFAPGLTDLSASNAPAPSLSRELGCQLSTATLDYVAPGGADDLRSKIAARYETLTADDVLITSGASEALVAIAFALLDHDSVALVDPATYPSFLHAARRIGAEVRWADEDPVKASVVVACNPAAPAGDILNSASFIRRSVGMPAVPVMDEVYRDLAVFGSRIRAAADLGAHAVSIGDLSKPLGMGGLRIGWIASRERGLMERFDYELQRLSGGPASLSVAAANVALDHFDELVGETCAAARANAPRVFEALHEAGWRFQCPQAGLTLLATPPRCPGPDAEAAVRAAGYFLIPARLLGSIHGYRISLLAPPNAVRSALRILDGH
jgi:aspartate/methionine/tyrosine aminotransferase